MSKLPIVDEFTDVTEVRRSAHVLLSAVLVLIGIGCISVYSASATVRAERELRLQEARAASVDGAAGLDGLERAAPPSPEGRSASDERVRAWEQASLKPLIGHLSKVGLGLLLLAIAAGMDYRRWSQWSLPFYLFALVLLLAVFVPGVGHDVKGARRWLNPALLGFAFQPSELAKLAVVVMIAALVARRPEAAVGDSFLKGFLPLALVTGIPAVLVMVETDFGTSLLIGFLGMSLLVLAGGRVVHLLGLAVAAAPVVMLVLMRRGDYVFDRLKGFQEPAPDSQLGFAMSAVKVGGFDGVGLGEGRHKLFYLAEIEDDFVLALIGEELGFLGITAVLALFAIVLWSGARILLGIRNRFGFFVVAGVLLTIATQALINLAVATGKVPVKGMPLPFVSAGGSSLAVLCLGVGMILSVARNPDRPSADLGSLRCGEP